jgi:hypothetical protein
MSQGPAITIITAGPGPLTDDITPARLVTRRLELGDVPPAGAPPCQRCGDAARIELEHHGAYCPGCLDDLVRYGRALEDANRAVEGTP